MSYNPEPTSGYLRRPLRTEAQAWADIARARGEISCRVWRHVGADGRIGMTAVFDGPTAEADAREFRRRMFPTGDVLRANPAVHGEDAWIVEAPVRLGEGLNGEVVTIPRSADEQRRRRGQAAVITDMDAACQRAAAKGRIE